MYCIYSQLIECADCVLPIENQSLIKISEIIKEQNAKNCKGKEIKSDILTDHKKISKSEAYDDMNAIASKVVYI